MKWARKRQTVWVATSLLAAVLLVGCKGGGLDRLTGGGRTPSGEVPAGPPANPKTGNPADPGTPGDPGDLTGAPVGNPPAQSPPTTPSASPSPTPSPVASPPGPGTAPTPTPSPSPRPTAPRIETYQFEGYVIAGGTYPAGIGVGDKVSGTFRVNLDRPLVAEFPGRGIYPAMESIQGTVGPSRFGGGDDYVYVFAQKALACALDTAHMDLDGEPINYDFFFFIADGQPLFPDHRLDNLHNLDRRVYRRVDLWFETDPANGGGFNADMYAFHRIDGPALAALSASDYVNVRW